MQDTILAAEKSGEMAVRVRVLTFIKEELEKLEQPLKQWSEPALHRYNTLMDVYKFVKSDAEVDKPNE